MGRSENVAAQSPARRGALCRLDARPSKPRASRLGHAPSTSGATESPARPTNRSRLGVQHAPNARQSPQPVEGERGTSAVSAQPLASEVVVGRQCDARMQVEPIQVYSLVRLRSSRGLCLLFLSVGRDPKRLHRSASRARRRRRARSTARSMPQLAYARGAQARRRCVGAHAVRPRRARGAPGLGRGGREACLARRARTRRRARRRESARSD